MQGTFHEYEQCPVNAVHAIMSVDFHVCEHMCVQML